YERAAQDCTTGLALDPKNVKALWRRGVCRKFLKRYTEAEQDLVKALKLEPINKAVQEELYIVQQYREAIGDQQGKATNSIPVEVLASEHDLHTILARDYSTPPLADKVRAPIPSPSKPAAPTTSGKVVAIPPTRYCALFQSTFDGDYLMDIVSIINNYYFT
ncbi:hypothetical protein H4R34_001871, partial [Dimargaris verticillata]